MKKQIKKVLIIFVLMLTMSAGILPAPVYAEDEETLVSLEKQEYVNPFIRDYIKPGKTYHLFGSAGPEAETELYDNLDAAADALKQLLKERKEKITIRFKHSEDDKEIGGKLLDLAYAHNGISEDGDYLFFTVLNIECGGSYGKNKEGSYTYTIEFSADYFTTVDQEQAVAAKADEIISSLGLNGKSDYEKIALIYDYLRRNVEYDYINPDDYYLKYTAYAALIDEKAVCQGYSQAFYRMLLEAGIDCRVVTSVELNHAWTIVCLDDLYYFADVTWDSETYHNYGVLKPRYFLKGTEDFTNHNADDIDIVSLEGIGAYNLAQNGYTLDHVFIESECNVAKDATCTEDGRLTGECRLCGLELNGIIPAKGHKLEKTEAVDATCTIGGNSAYWTCKTCGDYFSDAAGKTQIEENSWVIKATGHSLTKTAAKEPTCTETGNKEYWTCSGCHEVFKDGAGKEEYAENEWIIKASGHDLEKTEAVAATYSSAGNTEYWKCDACRDCFGDAEGKTKIKEGSWVIPKLVRVKSITLDKTEITLLTGQNVSLTADILPANADNKGIIWESSAPKVASISGKGVIKALTYGKAVITAKAADGQGAAASMSVNVLFNDVRDPDIYPGKYIYWAAEKGIVKGFTDGTFRPKAECTRSDMMIMLWRLAGRPAAKGTLAFKDCRSLSETSDRYKAILWGYTNGIVKGYSDGTFGKDLPVIRGDVMIMMYRMAGKPNVSGTLEFSDMPKRELETYYTLPYSVYITKTGARYHRQGCITVQRFNTTPCTFEEARAKGLTACHTCKPDSALEEHTRYNNGFDPNSDTYKSVLWGSKIGITTGYNDGTFGRTRNCLREEIATFVQRYATKVK